ncbi:uncharacterized [Tachysurus ichikawai]
MQWRHTPPLELGFSHGKMFPEFCSQAQRSPRSYGNASLFSKDDQEKVLDWAWKLYANWARQLIVENREH